MMPSVMPARVPNLLVNGADGIAVGMATKIPPHNLGEICDGLLALLDEPGAASPTSMLEYVQGPDFPTGGIIHGRRGICDYVTTGRGRVVVRARTDIEVEDGGRAKIIVTEIPYQVNKATLIEKIADLVRGGVDRGHQRPARRVRPRRHAHRDRAEEGRLPPGGAQQALHAHHDADDLRRDQPGAGGQPAPGHER